MKERRSQPRLLDTDLVIISWEHGGAKLKQLGNVNDVSLDGMGVLVDRALPEGITLQISYGEGQLTGVIRYSSQTYDGRFHMGIEFTENSKNSTLHFQPELLISATLE
jgi:hypothetical protein